MQSLKEGLDLLIFFEAFLSRQGISVQRAERGKGTKIHLRKH